MPHHLCRKTSIMGINIKISKQKIIMSQITLIKLSLMKDDVIHRQFLDNSRKRAVFYLP